MKVSNREGVSPGAIRKSWKVVKETLEYLHLSEFVLHALQSDVVALLLFVIARAAGWLVPAFVAGGLLLWLKFRRDGVAHMDEDKAVEGKESTESPEVESSELTIPAAVVPRNFVELAKQGVGVKITIELKPVARRSTSG